MNKIYLIGNLTTEITSGASQNGVNYARFCIAVNGRGKDSQSEFFNITAWRGLAENCVKFLQKGKKVCVVGSIQIRTYKAQDGTVKAAAEVTAEDIEFLSPKTNNSENNSEVLPEEKGEDLPF